MSIKNNVYKGLVILTLLSAHVSCAQQFGNVTNDMPSILSDTLFQIIHRFHYIDSTDSFNIRMYLSTNTKKSVNDLIPDQFEKDKILRDIYLQPFNIPVRDPKKAIEMFFLMLKIKDVETTSFHGENNPYVKFSNFYSKDLPYYTCAYANYQWGDKVSDIKLTIHSVTSQVFTLYESIYELQSDIVGLRTFLLAKAGNRIQITMNEDFAKKFTYRYAYFFK